MIFFDDEETAAPEPAREPTAKAVSTYRSGLVALLALAVIAIVVLTAVLLIWRPLLYWLGLIWQSVATTTPV